jgi:hypothetical protein
MNDFNAAYPTLQDTFPHQLAFQDLTECITKDGDSAVAYGGFANVWKCTYRMDNSEKPIKVRSQCHLYLPDQNF